MKKIKVKNLMKNNYEYELVEPQGKNFDKEFKPDLTPKEMLELGVFGGLYLNSAENEYPKEWFKKAKLSDVKNKKLNFFLEFPQVRIYLFGKRKGGYQSMILVVGLSGIVDITWDEEFPLRIKDKSKDGKQSKDIVRRLHTIVSLEICSVALDSDRHSCIGRTIVANSKS